MTATSKRARTAAALDYLACHFPAAFGTGPAAVAPLAVGVRPELVARTAADPEADAPAVLWALRRWCLSRAYVEAVAAGRPRVDLDGHPVEAPATEHQAQARARLEVEGNATAARAERRRKAERAQARAKEQAAASARQRAADKAAGRPAPVPARPAEAAAPGARPAAAAVVTRARAGRLTKPAPTAPAPIAPSTASPLPVLGLGKRPKPAE